MRSKNITMGARRQVGKAERWQQGISAVRAHFCPIGCLVLLCLCLCAALPSASAETSAEIVVDAIVAVVNGRVITQREIEVDVAFRPVADSGGNDRRIALNRLIWRELLLEEAMHWGILSIPGELLEQARAHLADRFESPDAFQDVLQQHAIEPEELQHWLQQTQIIDKFTSRQWTEPIRAQEHLTGQALQQEVDKRTEEWIRRRLSTVRIRIADPAYQTQETSIEPGGES